MDEGVIPGLANLYKLQNKVPGMFHMWVYLGPTWMEWKLEIAIHTSPARGWARPKDAPATPDREWLPAAGGHIKISYNGIAMSHDYFVRVTYPYDKIASMVSLWACRSQKLVVYEHVGTKTEKVHCHILILGSNTHKKQLRNIGATCVSLKGNELCSFKDCTSWETPVVYMTKGNLDPKYIKGFEQSEADLWKTKWTEPEKYERVSKDVKLYDDFWTDELFAKFENLKQPDVFEDMDKTTYYKYYFILKEAREYAFSVNGGIWNMKARNIYYMCAMTACMRHRIPISKRHKFGDII